MPDDLIVRHPPERGRSAPRPTLVYSGCCCLMYLHTVGAVLGAFLAGGIRRSPEELSVYQESQQRIPFMHRVFGRLPNSQWLFWTSLVCVIPPCLAAIVGLAYKASPGDWPLIQKYVTWDLGVIFPRGFQPPMLIGLAIVMTAVALSFLPLMCIPAWILGRIRLSWRPRGVDSSVERRGLLHMLMGAVVGAAVGLLAMSFLRAAGVELVPVRMF